MSLWVLNFTLLNETVLYKFFRLRRFVIIIIIILFITFFIYWGKAHVNPVNPAVVDHNRGHDDVYRMHTCRWTVTLELGISLNGCPRLRLSSRGHVHKPPWLGHVQSINQLRLQLLHRELSRSWTFWVSSILWAVAGGPDPWPVDSKDRKRDRRDLGPMSQIKTFW
jgi:hypothetical protein